MVWTLNKPWQKRERKNWHCDFPVHDCTLEENGSPYFSSVVRQCKWPSLSRKNIEIRKFCYDRNVTSHVSALLWKSIPLTAFNTGERILIWWRLLWFLFVISWKLTRYFQFVHPSRSFSRVRRVTFSHIFFSLDLCCLILPRFNWQFSHQKCAFGGNKFYL